MQIKKDISSKIFEYFRKKGILINKEKFTYTLKSHPQYPQLISIVDTFDFFNIEYDVYEAYSVQEIEKNINYFIALFKKTNNFTELSFVERNNNLYKIDSVNVPLNVVNKYWGNIVLILGENKKFKNKKNHKLTVYISTSILIFLVLMDISDFKFSILGFFTFPIFGLLLSIIILKDIFGLNSSFSEKICKASKKRDCQAIISSKKWKLFKVLDFSDLSLTFFVSQLAFLFISLFFNAENIFFQLQFIAILVSTPLIFTSLYYQKFVERKWCTLCLGIITILILECSYIVIFIKELNFHMQIHYDFIFLNVTIYVSIYLFWKIIKKLLLKNKEYVDKDIISNRTILSYSVFKAIIKTGGKYNTELDFLNFNNYSGHQNITLITDPFCEHCKNLHKKFLFLPAKFQDSINWNVVFNVNLEEEPELDKSIYRNMMSIQITENNIFFKESINEWHKHENEEKWLEKYSQEFDAEKVDFILNKQYKWCIENSLNYNPVLLINGYLLPSIYNVEDLKFFIEELSEDISF